jgi:hypothetical protein
MRSEIHRDVGEQQRLFVTTRLGAPDYSTEPRDELSQTE